MTMLPSLALLLLASIPFSLPLVHPHVPKAIVLQGAGGKAPLCQRERDTRLGSV